MKQTTDRNDYFKEGNLGVEEQNDASYFSEPMVAADLHRYVEQLQQPAKEGDHEKHERNTLKTALGDLIQEQTSKAKKQELFTYLRSKTSLFSTDQTIRPQHLDFFYHLYNHFPLTCNQFEKEMYAEIPELKNRMQIPVETHTKAQKKESVATYRYDDKKHSFNSIPSFLYCLATKIDAETLHEFALRVEDDTRNLLGQELPHLSKIFSDGPTKMGQGSIKAMRVISDELQETFLPYTWPAETIAFATKSNGRIKLRSDGKFDMYLDNGEIFLKGVQRLTSTEETNPQKGIIQGTHKDEEGEEGIPGITYMSPERAMKEAKKQGLCLLKESEVAQKRKTFLTQLGPTGKKQIQALEILFGKQYSRAWSPTHKKWTYSDNYTILACSEILSDGGVELIRWCKYYPGCIYDGRVGEWGVTDDGSYYPFIAFEEC